MNILVIGNTYKRIDLYMEEFIKKNVPQNRIIRVSKKPNFRVWLDDGTTIEAIIAEDYKIRGRRADKCYIDDEVSFDTLDYAGVSLTVNSFLPEEERISFWGW